MSVAIALFVPQLPLPALGVAFFVVQGDTRLGIATQANTH